jgi:predicted DNA-binding protein YlxM (UPF0122 family)
MKTLDDLLRAPEPDDRRRMISLGKIADELGVSAKFLRREIQRGHLIAHRAAGKLKVSKQNYSRYLELIMEIPGPKKPKERTR